MRIVLIEPEIPQNTGNIARLASAIGAELWLVGRLGFSMTDKYMKRAGMDYWEKVNYRIIPTLDEFYMIVGGKCAFISTKAERLYTSIPEEVGDIVFGSESSGLPPVIYDKYKENLYRIPMYPGIRSLNLATSVGIVSYHILAQNGFPNLI